MVRGSAPAVANRPTLLSWRREAMANAAEATTATMAANPAMATVMPMDTRVV